ncbi:MAG: penicillin acylase family protein [Solirubrobacterales bacterium]|nr:penicillin acylase family protein [Solirubrobacterales bacterium]
MSSSRNVRPIAVLIGLGALLLALLAAPLAGQADAAKAPRVTIRTTEYGIPRILADTPYGLGYGYGWSIASQQICTLADTYTTVRGERSKYFGAANDAPNGISNLDSDFFWKRVRAEGTVRKMMNLKPPNGPLPDVKKVVSGYVAGYNAYLRKRGVKRLPDPTCRGKAWVKPITVLDAYHRFYQLLGYGSTDPSMGGIAEAQPPAPTLMKGGDDQADQAPGPDEITREDFGPDFGNFTGGLGSNAVGLGRNAVKGGKGLLLGNPHFPWHGSQRFFESQLTIPGKVNVSGASLLGVPVILIGHTRQMAWSHTVSTARRFIVFQETLDPSDPTRYIVDGQSKPMKRTTVTVTDENGNKHDRTLYSTEHGYITDSVQGQPLFGWSPTTAYSLFDANTGNFRMINHFYAINRAQSTPQVLQILKKYQGIPWVNTIASDSKGRALYADIGAVPNASDERVEQCNTPGIGTVAWSAFRLPVFDGSNSNCDMSKKVPGAAGPGLLPANQMPYEMRSDYVENSNDSYWFANVHKTLDGFDRIIGEEKIAQTERTRLGHKMVNEKLAGGGKFTLASLKAMEFNDRVESAELLLQPVIAYCNANPIMIGESGPVAVSAGCEALASWDGKNNLDSTGGLLFQQFIARLFSGSTVPVYADAFDVSDPIGTPKGLNTANPNLPIAFADTVSQFVTEGIPLTATRRQYQTVTRAGVKIPIHGGDYEPFGSFNTIWGPWVPGQGITEVSDGSSFIQAVHLTGAKCPQASMILTYSQSENPKSKHYADQTKLFSKKRWVTDRFCPNQQKRSPGLKVTRFGGGAKAARRGF